MQNENLSSPPCKAHAYELRHSIYERAYFELYTLIYLRALQPYQLAKMLSRMFLRRFSRSAPLRAGAENAPGNVSALANV